MQSTPVFQMIVATIDKHPIFYNPVWRTIFRAQREQIFDLKSSNCADFYSLDLMINQNPISVQNRNSFFNFFFVLYKQLRYPF